MSTVTVVIPTHPGRELLMERALASVWAQTRQPDAVIVSRDPTRTGAAKTRNRALEMVTTEWVAWLDSDDELLPNHLADCLAHAEESGADLVYPYMIPVGDRDPLAFPVNGILVKPYQHEFGQEQAWHLYNVGNFIPVTYIVKTRLAQAVGGMPEPVAVPIERSGSGRIEEDYGFLLRLLDAGATFSHCPSRTWKYHFHDQNVGGRGLNQV